MDLDDGLIGTVAAGRSCTIQRSTAPSSRVCQPSRSSAVGVACRGSVRGGGEVGELEGALELGEVEGAPPAVKRHRRASNRPKAVRRIPWISSVLISLSCARNWCRSSSSGVWSEGMSAGMRPRHGCGLGILVSRHVPAGQMWVLDPQWIKTVLREDVTLAVSYDSRFTSDRVALRATLRVGFAFPKPAALVRIDLSGAEG